MNKTPFLQGLSDKELCRLRERVRRIIYHPDWSGDPYGWDLPTLWAVRPGVASAWTKVNGEIARRIEARHKSA